jgi:hypothetical protein
MMNIRLKQLAAQACLALGLIMSNAQSMDAFTPPLSSAAYTAARQKQMQEAASSIMNAGEAAGSLVTDGATVVSSREAVLNAAQLFAGSWSNFRTLVSRVIERTDHAVHTAIINLDGTLGSDRVFCGQNSADKLTLWTTDFSNPIRDELARGQSIMKENGAQALSAETLTLARVVAHGEGKVRTIVLPISFTSKTCIDLIAVEGNESWELLCRTYGPEYPSVAFLALIGAVNCKLEPQNIGGYLSQHAEAARARGESPEEIQQVCGEMRAVAEWAVRVALASGDVVGIANDILQRSGYHPAIEEGAPKQLWVVGWPDQAE